MNFVLKGAPRLKVSTTYGQRGVFIKLANLVSTLDVGRANSFIRILSRMLECRGVVAKWIDLDTFQCVSTTLPSIIAYSPEDLVRIAHDEIKQVANLAGVKCDFEAFTRF